MKVVGLLFFIIALVAVSTAQTLTVKGNPADLQVVKMSWKRESRSAREAYPKDKKPTDEQLHGKEVPPTQAARAERTQQPSVYDNVTRPGQEVEELWPSKGPLVSGYLYQITVRNTGRKEIKTINWQYIFTDSHDPNIVTRHQFLSRTKISPGKETKLSKFTLAAPTQVVNAKAIASNSKQSYLEQVLITRIEYLDGSVWERPAE